ncbi:MAG: 2-oxoglutarate dehydrogenase complex dihydrolipoyllysine-residue succinyltransferase [Bacteroidales bacterium]|nr:2-oxoglutarate dehydrogenase complex dihydrolipoyllysine-residue succinyltransferase [Bacteroidales bacterium]
MIIDIKIPSPGESITEVELAQWLVDDGSYVEKDQELAEIESDKATLPIIAEDSGKLSIVIEEGTTVKIGDIACKIDTSAKKPANEESPAPSNESSNTANNNKKEEKASTTTENITKPVKEPTPSKIKATPLAKKLMEENQVDVNDIINGLKKITTKEVKMVIGNTSIDSVNSFHIDKSREEQREKMSNLRKKLSQRLVDVKNQTAMLTTFNEVDMSKVIELRKKYQEVFIKKHGIKLGFMSFFTKASSIALKLFPKVNSMIDGDEIITPSYVDISMAVQTDKGLMVPVLRNTESMSLAEIELTLKDLAEKARKFRLSIEEMTGGTFTITNGGVFGSMLSTPIINPPQSGILGMHNIVERPAAINGTVEIRPIMYVALSYDHRIIDGRDSVSFLYKIKELIENPTLMLTEGISIDEKLLDI